jgi:hypothetical protein
LTVTAPVAATTTTVVATVDSSTLAPGHSSQGRAVPMDAQGNVLTGKTASWVSKNTAIATVSSTTGVVTGVSAGSVVIQATIDGVVGQASLNVSVPSVITAPAPSSGTLASADFEDGTFGSFYNPWSTGIDVVSDPTGGGRSKVARTHYTTNGTTQVDHNLDLTPKSLAIGLGDSLWFTGDFYLDANANMTASGPSTVQRKLLYWGWNGSGGHPFDMVLTSFGPQMVISNYPHPSFEPGGLTYLPVYITAGRWHTLKVQLRINSSFGASDGILRIWFDGALVFDHADMRWTDPSWTDVAPSNYKWTDWGVGTQVSTGVPDDEYRYWDNLVFASTSIQP